MAFPTLLIFAACIALIFGLLTGAGSLIFTWDPEVAGAAAVMVFLTTFCAVIFLGLKDWLREWQLDRSVSKRLLQRPDLTDEEFLAAFPAAAREIAQHTRTYIALRFRVPESKLRPGDQLRRDYEFEGFRGVPDASLYVLGQLQVQLPPLVAIGKSLDAFSTLHDLVSEIQRLTRLTSEE